MKYMRLFIDVGVGYQNTEAWGRTGDFDLIIGLEPHTDRYNNLEDVFPGELLNLAVSDKDGEIECWEGKGGLGVFIEPEIKSQYKKVKKKAITLDTLYKKYGKNANEVHIWADIEGAELLMLKGAKRLLSSGKVKWINLEIRNWQPAEGWATAKEIYEFLDKYNFKPSISISQLSSSKFFKDVEFIQK